MVRHGRMGDLPRGFYDSYRRAGRLFERLVFWFRRGFFRHSDFHQLTLAVLWAWAWRPSRLSPWLRLNRSGCRRCSLWHFGEASGHSIRADPRQFPAPRRLLVTAFLFGAILLRWLLFWLCCRSRTTDGRRLAFAFTGDGVPDQWRLGIGTGVIFKALQAGLRRRVTPA